MMKKVFLTAGLLWVGTSAFAQSIDIARTITIGEVQIVANRATEQTPVAYTNVGQDEIGKLNYGQDLPFLLLQTPSVVATSDAGTGVGYTGIRIRGTDASRINVTANGIPMNDAESHSMFWVNTPDLVSSVDDIQVQRGVGTSTNGAGAFGGSINLSTEALDREPFGEFSGSYGSFNTHKETAKFGTGLMNGRWALSGRLSNIHSDGYVERASVDMKSFFVQGGYYSPRTTVRLIAYGGKEETYHAWNGLTADEMREFGRRYNSCGIIADANGDPIPGLYYDDQTDNYTQYNYQLLINRKLGPGWNLNVNFHYTDGYGYYEEYKNGETLLTYTLNPYRIEVGGVPTDVENSNLVRRKLMDNWFGGTVVSADYKDNKLHFSVGGAANRYDGNHFGRVMWVQQYAGDWDFQPGHEYYRNEGVKDDVNFYARANWNAAPGLWLFGDMQYRHIHYTIKGANDKWNDADDAMQVLAVDEKYDFANPKIGAHYDINRSNNVYASFAVAHKEPTRNNFTDALNDVMPRAERMLDWEVGYEYSSPLFTAGVNLYYMKYKDQLILTGQVNHIGEPLADNVPDSYRAGIEASAGVKITSWLRWDATATFSRNRIRNYTEYVTRYDGWNVLGQQANYLGSTTISYSPSVTAASLITATYENLTVALQSNYVGSQYVTNSEIDELSLDAYFVNNLRLNYDLQVPSLRGVSVGVALNNIFGEVYESNGYGWSAYSDDGSGGFDRSESIYYFPQAGFNVLASLAIKF